MDISRDHHKVNTHRPGVFSTGLQGVRKILHWLVRMVTTTEQEMAEAGVVRGKLID